MFNRLLEKVEIAGFLRHLWAFLVESEHSKKESDLEEMSTKRVFCYFKLGSTFQSPWCLSISPRTLMSSFAASSQGSECSAGGNKMLILSDAWRLLFHLWKSPLVARSSCKMTFPEVLAPGCCQSSHVLIPAWP